jgi:hypothetical protein
MLLMQASPLHFASRPVKLFSKTPPPRASHCTQRRYLLSTGLFVKQPVPMVTPQCSSGKRWSLRQSTKHFGKAHG